MEHIRNKKIVAVLISILIVTILGNILVSFAATSSADLEKERKANQSKINEAKDEQNEVRTKMTAIQKEVEELNAKIASYENEIDDLTSQIDETSANIDTMTQELTKKEKELEEKEELLKKRLVASYKAGSTSYLDVLLSSGSLTSFLSNYYLIEQLAESDQKLIDTITTTKNQVAEAKVQLEENKKKALDVNKSEKNEKVAQLSDEDKKLQQQIEDMQSQDSAIRAAIKKAQATEEAAKKAAESNKNNGNKNNGGNSSSPSSNPGGFIYPVPSAYAKITTGLYYSNGSYHGGVDFGSGGIAGQPVYAVKSGTVILALALTTSYGNYVVIDHHDGTYTLYAHGQAGSICVSPGQSVSQGQQIMKVGSTGNSTGAHLHFEVRVSPGGYNNRVSPLNYLP